MIEAIMNKDNKHHLDFWNNVANSPTGQQHNWDEVFKNYTAAVDNPACCVWKELLQAYPDAKVILTLHPRGAEGWYESTIDTIYFTETRWQFKVLELFTPFAKKMGNMSRKLIWGRSHKGTMNNKERALKHYKDHIDDVKASVPAGKLLVFTVTEGWDPLCKFLGVPIPSSEFPNVNDRAQVKKTIADITKGAYLFLAIGALILVGIIYGVVKLMS